MIPNVPDTFKPKSFWERPEGTTGMLVGIPLVLLLTYGLYKLLPFIIKLLENVLYATILGCVTAAIVYIVSDKRFRTLIWNVYKSFMRVVTGVFVTIDPIGILKNYASDLEENANDMEEQVSNLRGQMKKLENVININERDRQNNLKLAKCAKDQDKNSLFVLKARKAGMLEDSNLTLKGLYNKMEMLYKILCKMLDTCKILLESMNDEIDVKEREHEMMKASYSAYKRAVNILKGDTDKKEMFDQAMEFLADDYGRKLGEIEHFMDVSKNFIDSIDLQNGVYEDKALQQLESWEKQTDSILLGDQKHIIVNSMSVKEPVVVTEVVSNEYKKLFE